MFVVERATGQQRAVLVHIEREADGGYISRPVALLLEQDDDIDRFTPPTEATP